MLCSPPSRVISFTRPPCCPRHHYCTSVHPRPHYPYPLCFPSSKNLLLPQMVDCYFVFLPAPIRPHPHNRPSVCPQPCHPLPVVVCCIYFHVFISISSPFQTVFQFWAAVPQFKRGMWYRQCVQTKDKNEGHRHGQSARMKSLEDRQRAWTTDE